MYKVFIKDLPLNFVQNGEPRQVQVNGSIEHIDDPKLILDLNAQGKNIAIYGTPSEDMKWVFSDYELIIAGGGLVTNAHGKTLFIFRNDKWDIPKGKLDPNESVAECAVREVEEETGATGLSIVRELPSTYHTYTQNGQPILKRTYWYEMSIDGDQNLVPQTEEGITKIEWIAVDDFLKGEYETYVSIRTFLEQTTQV